MDASESTSLCSKALGLHRPQLLDPCGFGATVKRLYLSGQAGGVELRALLENNEGMETDQPESNFGRLAASASGSAAG